MHACRPWRSRVPPARHTGGPATTRGRPPWRRRRHGTSNDWWAGRSSAVRTTRRAWPMNEDEAGGLARWANGCLQVSSSILLRSHGPVAWRQMFLPTVAISQVCGHATVYVHDDVQLPVRPPHARGARRGKKPRSAVRASPPLINYPVAS
jgi:hypothetical protein